MKEQTDPRLRRFPSFAIGGLLGVSQAVIIWQKNSPQPGSSVGGPPIRIVARKYGLTHHPRRFDFGQVFGCHKSSMLNLVAYPMGF
jgi:hypothetical protein